MGEQEELTEPGFREEPVDNADNIPTNESEDGATDPDSTKPDIAVDEGETGEKSIRDNETDSKFKSVVKIIGGVLLILVVIAIVVLIVAYIIALIVKRNKQSIDPPAKRTSTRWSPTESAASGNLLNKSVEKQRLTEADAE